MTKNRTPTPVYLDPGMHPGLEVKGLIGDRSETCQRSNSRIWRKNIIYDKSYKIMKISYKSGIKNDFRKQVCNHNLNGYLSGVL